MHQRGLRPQPNICNRSREKGYVQRKAAKQLSHAKKYHCVVFHIAMGDIRADNVITPAVVLPSTVYDIAYSYFLCVTLLLCCFALNVFSFPPERLQIS